MRRVWRMLIGGLVLLFLSGSGVRADFMVDLHFYTDLSACQEEGQIPIPGLSTLTPDQTGYDPFAGSPDLGGDLYGYPAGDTAACFRIGLGGPPLAPEIAADGEEGGPHPYIRLEGGSVNVSPTEKYVFAQLFGSNRSLQNLFADWGSFLEHSSGINIRYEEGGFYAGMGVASEDPFRLLGSGLIRSSFPRVFMFAGLKTNRFSIQPNFTLRSRELTGKDGADRTVYGYLFEVPVALRKGLLGAKVAGHWGLNMPDSEAASDLRSSEIQGEDSGNGPHTVSWGGYFDVSFGGKPLAIHVIGGLQHVQRTEWDDKSSDTRWAALLRIPYTLGSRFSLSPEVAYFSSTRRVSTKGGAAEDGDEWLAGVRFEFHF